MLIAHHSVPEPRHQTTGAGSNGIMYPIPCNPGDEQPGQASAGTRDGSRCVFGQILWLGVSSDKTALSLPASPHQRATRRLTQTVGRHYWYIDWRNILWNVYWRISQFIMRCLEKASQSSFCPGGV